MKRAILVLFLSPFLMLFQGNEKVTEKEFNELILGRWRLTELSIDGFNRTSEIVVYEYSPDKLITNDKSGRHDFATWQFYEKPQIMILKKMTNGRLWSYKMHYVTSDSLSYEYVTVDGIKAEKWTKIKP